MYSWLSAILVYTLSIAISDNYVGGDQAHYRGIYENIAGLSMFEAFLLYSNSLDSIEVVHFIVIFFSSLFDMDKDLVMGLGNAMLALLFVRLACRLGAKAELALFISVSNFYFIVLYFSAERLKFGFIFLILTLLFIDRKKLFCFFASLSIIAHIQILINLVSIAASVFLVEAKNMVIRKKLKISLLAILLILLIPLFLMLEQLITKLLAYNDGDFNFISLTGVLIFFLLSLSFGREYVKKTAIFSVLFFAAAIVGPERVNMLAYFSFLFFGLSYNGGVNLSVLTTSLYFSFKSIPFLKNILDYGNGFVS